VTRFKRFAGSLLVIVAVGLIGYSVFAKTGDAGSNNSAEAGKKIAVQLDQNKMTLAKAVTAAEEHSKGRAISAISEIHEHDQVVLHVWCVAGEAPNAPKILKCFVDFATGKVRGMKEVHDFPVTALPGDRQHDPHAPRDHAPHAPHDHEPHASPSAKVITNLTVEAACGVCIYRMPGLEGCPLAVKIDGRAYLVEGAEWPNHDYCERTCQAIVSGRIEGDKFVATKLEPKK
jgi:hypothetical protein